MTRRAAVPGGLTDRGTDGSQPASGRAWANRVLIASTLVSLLIFFGVWYLLRQFALSDRERFLLPAPHDVWSKGFADADARGEILQRPARDGQGGCRGSAHRDRARRRVRRR